MRKKFTESLSIESLLKKIKSNEVESNCNSIFQTEVLNAISVAQRKVSSFSVHQNILNDIINIFAKNFFTYYLSIMYECNLLSLVKLF